MHPFNDAAVVAGQGTVALEILEDLPDVDVVVVPVGGGGLVSGVATAVQARRPNARVIAVEPERSAALHDGPGGRSLGAGDAEERRRRAQRAVRRRAAVEICSRLGVESVLVSEDELADAFRWLYVRTKLACELGAAASTAALLSGKVQVEPGENVVAVVSGGNIASKQAAAILAS